MYPLISELSAYDYHRILAGLVGMPDNWDEIQEEVIKKSVDNDSEAVFADAKDIEQLALRISRATVLIDAYEADPYEGYLEDLADMDITGDTIDIMRNCVRSMAAQLVMWKADFEQQSEAKQGEADPLSYYLKQITHISDYKGYRIAPKEISELEYLIIVEEIMTVKPKQETE